MTKKKTADQLVTERHGQSRTRLYKIWAGMIKRCHNPNATNYPRYGARGIAVCERWRTSFLAFQADMGAIPFDGATLERKRNAEGYSPDNCVWSTPKQQANNRRNTPFVEYQGKRIAIGTLASETGVSRTLLVQRIVTLGWPVEKAVATPSARA